MYNAQESGPGKGVSQIGREEEARAVNSLKDTRNSRDETAIDNIQAPGTFAERVLNSCAATLPLL